MRCVQNVQAVQIAQAPCYILPRDAGEDQRWGLNGAPAIERIERARRIFAEAVRTTNADLQFAADYKRLTGRDDPSPLNPDEQAKIVRDIPRDAEIVELFKKFAGTAPLPPR